MGNLYLQKLNRKAESKNLLSSITAFQIIIGDGYKLHTLNYIREATLYSVPPRLEVQMLVNINSQKSFGPFGLAARRKLVWIVMPRLSMR